MHDTLQLVWDTEQLFGLEKYYIAEIRWSEATLGCWNVWILSMKLLLLSWLTKWIELSDLKSFFVDHVHVTDKVSFFQSFGVIGMTQQILPFKLGTILQTGKERNLFSTQ